VQVTIVMRSLANYSLSTSIKLASYEHRMEVTDRRTYQDCAIYPDCLDTSTRLQNFVVPTLGGHSLHH